MRAWTVGGAVLLAGATLAGMSCEQRQGVPAAPSAPGLPTSSDQIGLCHRQESGAFVLVTAPEADVPTHLAHGDGWVGDAVPGLPSLKFGPGCAILPLESEAITFAGLTVNGSAVSVHQEAGFTVSRITGQWEAMANYGKPAPAIIFKRLAPESPVTAEMSITSVPALFGFASVELYSSMTPIPYTLTGLRKSATVFELSGTIPNTFGAFARVTNPNPDLRIDTLLIRLSNPGPGNPVGFDTVVLRR
jgi:hypothetical protein